MNANLTSGGVLRVSVALVVILGLLAGAAAFFLHGSHPAATASTGDEPGEPEELAIPVKSVHPRYDQSFYLTEKRPASVEPYFETPLETRVPGLVLEMKADVGSVVSKGKELVKVDVPDLDAREKQGEADYNLAQAQIIQKDAAIETAKAQLTAAEAKREAARAREKSDIAYREFRRKQAARYKALLSDRAIDIQLVDEQTDRLEAAIQAVDAAHEAVAYAKSEVAAASARIKQAKADREEAEKNADAKKAAWNYTKAMLGYATIRAPYDGQIVRRDVDPGFFVQNAGTGHATPLLIIQRNDIVTLKMQVPDNFAPYVTPETEAIFETPSLPGVKIKGKVTRFPQSLITPDHSRTMLVEVDLWNRSAEEFNKVKDKKEFKDGLKPGLPADPRGGEPIVPKIEGKAEGGQQLRLLPGMFGDMTLVLRKFNDVYMLPSSALVAHGGVQYIYVVKHGKAHLQRVKEQVNDGKLVKLELLDENGEVIGDLTGKEEVIITNQGELSEGQPVKAVDQENWNSLISGKDGNEKR